MRYPSIIEASMTPEYVLFISRRAIETALLLSAPVLAVALVVGFVTSLFQAVTSIRDMTIGTVLKLVSVGVTLLIAGNWMMQVAMSYTIEIFGQVQALGH
jgi:flagellar biosynthetic protein FliQ